MRALTPTDLESQSGELLPARETLFYFDVSNAEVWASNTSAAVNAGSLFSSANSTATQAIVVSQ